MPTLPLLALLTLGQLAGEPGHPPVSLGVRLSAAAGEYAAPGLGGHLRLEPWAALGIELFSDNHLRLPEGRIIHDHVVGFGLYAPTLWGGERWRVSPIGGLCVDLRFAHAQGDGPSAGAVAFGAHGGLMGEWRVAPTLSLQASAAAYAYLGSGVDVERWTANVSSGLTVTPRVLAVLAVNHLWL